MVEVQKLSPLQLEILKTYSFHPTDEDLLAIKTILANYFSKKMIEKVDKSIAAQNLTEKDLEIWINE